VILLLTLKKIVYFEAKTYCQCLESAITVHFKCSFLLTLALKTRTCVMAPLIFDLIEIRSRHDQIDNLIEIPVPYRLPMGS
jgi:hypothetical protein